MKVSDVIRELEIDATISPKAIHILGNMMADVAWCKQGIKQQFECYNELVAIVKALTLYLNTHSDALDAIQEKVRKEKDRRDNVSSEPGELEEVVTPYNETLK
jgi:hypothetical protein